MLVWFVVLSADVVCSPEFRFSDHIERATLDDDQPKKMLLKRDPDTYEVRDACSAITFRNHTFTVATSQEQNALLQD